MLRRSLGTGDIEGIPNHAAYLAIRAARERAGAVLNPAPLAVSVLDPERGAGDLTVCKRTELSDVLFQLRATSHRDRSPATSGGAAHGPAGRTDRSIVG